MHVILEKFQDKVGRNVYRLNKTLKKNVSSSIFDLDTWLDCSQTFTVAVLKVISYKMLKMIFLAKNDCQWININIFLKFEDNVFSKKYYAE